MKPYIKIFILFALILTYTVLTFTPTNNYCKRFIIRHQCCIEKIEENQYVINFTNTRYFDDVTINLLSDSTYSVVFWGNRDSWLWRFKLDKCFTVDIPYNKYKGKNVKLDNQLLKALNYCDRHN